MSKTRSQQKDTATKTKGRPPRRPGAPVVVASALPVGTIALFAVVILAFAAIVGGSAYVLWFNSQSPQEKAAGIEGVVDYYHSKPKMLTRNHVEGDLEYEVRPPVGGDHNVIWQNCMGDIYEKPISEEHAVHSLEHGAIWVVYRPDLPKEKVEALKEKVKGQEYMMMSPYPGLDADFSLLAWGFRLDLKDPNDERWTEFVEALRTEGPEEGAACSGGVTATGDSPREVEGGMPQGAQGG